MVVADDRSGGGSDDSGSDDDGSTTDAGAAGPPSQFDDGGSSTADSPSADDGSSSVGPDTSPPGGQTQPDDASGADPADSGSTTDDGQSSRSTADAGAAGPPSQFAGASGGSTTQDRDVGPNTSPSAAQVPPGSRAVDRPERPDTGGRTSPVGGEGPPSDVQRSARDGTIGGDVPTWARDEARRLQQEVAGDIYGAVGPEDVRVTYADGQLEAQVTAEGRREIQERAQRQQASEFRQQVAEQEGVDPSQVSIREKNGQFVAELSDDARREVAADQLGVATEDVEIVPQGPGTSPVGGVAPPEDATEVRLTDEGLQEYTAEQSPDIAGIGTVEVVQTSSGREVQFTEAERQRRAEAQRGAIGEVTAGTPVAGVFEEAGDRFEPVAEGAASLTTLPSRAVASAGERAGVPGAGRVRGGLESVEEGAGQAFNVPRAGADLAYVGEGIAYGLGADDDIIGDPVGTARRTPERLGTLGEAGEEVGSRAVRGAVENPTRTAGAVVGGAVVGTGLARGVGAGVRGARGARSGSASAAGTTPSSAGTTSRVRGAASDVADRAPVNVIRDPDAPMVEVTPEFSQAIRGAPRRAADAAGQGIQRARLGARRVRRDLGYVDPVTDARAAVRVGGGRIRDRAGVARSRIERDLGYIDPVTDARVAARVGADRIADVPGRVASGASGVYGTARAVPGQVAEGIGQRAVGARVRQSRLREEQLRGVGAQDELVSPSLPSVPGAGAARSGLGRVRQALDDPDSTDLGRALPATLGPREINVRYFESTRGSGTTIGGRPLASDVGATPLSQRAGGALRAAREAELPSFSAPSLTDYTIRLGSRPPRRPGYALGELEEGRIVEVDLTDGDSVSVTPRSEPAQRFQSGDGAEVGSGQIQATGGAEQQAVQVQRVDTEQQTPTAAPDGTDLSEPATGTGLATFEESFGEEAGSLAIDQQEVGATVADETSTTEVSDDLTVSSESLAMTEEAQQSEVTGGQDQGVSVASVTEPQVAPGQEQAAPPSIGFREEAVTETVPVQELDNQQLVTASELGRPRFPPLTPNRSPTGAPTPGPDPSSWVPEFSTGSADLNPSYFAEEVTFRATGEFAESPSQSELAGYSSGIEGRDFFPTQQMLGDDETAEQIDAEVGALDPSPSGTEVDVGLDFGGGDGDSDESGWLL